MAVLSYQFLKTTLPFSIYILSCFIDTRLPDNNLSWLHLSNYVRDISAWYDIVASDEYLYTSTLSPPIRSGLMANQPYISTQITT